MVANGALEIGSADCSASLLQRGRWNTARPEIESRINQGMQAAPPPYTPHLAATTPLFISGWGLTFRHGPCRYGAPTRRKPLCNLGSTPQAEGESAMSPLRVTKIAGPPFFQRPVARFIKVLIAMRRWRRCTNCCVAMKRALGRPGIKSA